MRKKGSQVLPLSDMESLKVSDRFSGNETVALLSGLNRSFLRKEKTSSLLLSLAMLDVHVVARLVQTLIPCTEAQTLLLSK